MILILVLGGMHKDAQTKDKLSWITQAFVLRVDWTNDTSLTTTSRLSMPSNTLSNVESFKYRAFFVSFFAFVLAMICQISHVATKKFLILIFFY